MNKKHLLIAIAFSNLVFANPELVKAAKERLKHFVIYDGSYRSIAYPNGDISKNRGVCSDVLIRSYRLLGVDLQKRVHEDMLAHFSVYPKIWGLSKPDRNIDHRRVPNLETFFKRHGTSLSLSKRAKDYKPGNIVSWRLDNNLPHIGIVSDIPSKKDSSRYQIIHNIGLGPQLDDVLFDYKIVGHYSF